jgi:hypothetical protein
MVNIITLSLASCCSHLKVASIILNGKTVGPMEDLGLRACPDALGKVIKNACCCRELNTDSSVVQRVA